MIRKTILIMGIVGLVGVASASQEPVVTDDPEPAANGTEARETPLGELLYENHCRSCHESNAHLRENRKARSPEEVRGWVVRWARDLKLRWSDEQVDAVVAYLRDKYYKF